MIRPEVGKRYLVTQPGMSFRGTVDAIGTVDGIEYVILKEVRDHPDPFFNHEDTALTQRLHEWEYEEVRS